MGPCHYSFASSGMQRRNLSWRYHKSNPVMRERYDAVKAHYLTSRTKRVEADYQWAPPEQPAVQAKSS
ncbi:hypothetical protein CCACVL1_30145 [Corchorus capsularis]|uniref:Uncharacterized protein n=1 Tax=Corchorus capsularis TaxID=210143 RepID=A0A1R3FYM8_COCAP|nr:hypothetical protein CCACVL1_30145 [Corchorus capsularis]